MWRLTQLAICHNCKYRMSYIWLVLHLQPQSDWSCLLFNLILRPCARSSPLKILTPSTGIMFTDLFLDPQWGFAFQIWIILKSYLCLTNVLSVMDFPSHWAVPNFGPTPGQLRVPHEVKQGTGSFARPKCNVLNLPGGRLIRLPNPSPVGCCLRISPSPCSLDSFYMPP